MQATTSRTMASPKITLRTGVGEAIMRRATPRRRVSTSAAALVSEVMKTNSSSSLAAPMVKRVSAFG